MQKVIDGISKFRQSAFDSQLFERLSKGQQPLALFITCSDSRIDPNLLTQTSPGDLFVLRNAGNIVPPYEAALGAEAATIEYAMQALKVKDIIVCGHSFCGAMDGLLHLDQLQSLEAVTAWLSHADATLKRVEERCAGVTDDAARLVTTIEQNVLVQLENLKTHPTVADAMERGDLNLHGWNYKFETGQVFSYDQNADQFMALDQLG